MVRISCLWHDIKITEKENRKSYEDGRERELNWNFPVEMYNFYSKLKLNESFHIHSLRVFLGFDSYTDDWIRQSCELWRIKDRT